MADDVAARPLTAESQPTYKLHSARGMSVPAAHRPEGDVRARVEGPWSIPQGAAWLALRGPWRLPGSLGLAFEIQQAVDSPYLWQFSMDLRQWGESVERRRPRSPAATRFCFDEDSLDVGKVCFDLMVHMGHGVFHFTGA